MHLDINILSNKRTAIYSQRKHFLLYKNAQTIMYDLIRQDTILETKVMVSDVLGIS